MSIHKLHFDFNHLDEPGKHTMYLKVRGKKYPLNVHNENTLREAALVNKAVNTLLKKKPKALTHYVDVPQAHFLNKSLTRIQVVGHADESDPNNYLPPLYHVSFMPHFDDHVKYFKKLVAKKGMLAPHALMAHGLNTVPNDDPWQHLVDQYHLKGPQDVAVFLAGQHPMTMSNKPQTHLAMQNEHIFPVHGTDPDSINQCNNIAFLTSAIKSQGQPGPKSGFAIVKQSVDPSTQKPMVYEYDLGNRKTGDAVLVYDLTDQTNEWLAAAAAHPVQTSRNDPQFQNQTWSVNQGQSSYDIANQNASANKQNAAILAAMAAAVGGKWQVSPNSSTHGMTVDQSSIQFDAQSNFSVDVYNNFLRIVGAYVQFYSDVDMKNPISNPKGWVEKSIPSIFETDSKKYIEMIPNVDTIMGIPMPTDPTNLKFVWPEDAQAARLMFGGIGTYNYDEHIVWPGFIETGIFQFGVPVFFMAAGAAVTDSQWYKDFIKDTDNIAAAAGVAFAGGSAAFGAYAAVKGLEKALFTFGDIIAGLLVKKGMEVLTEKILTRIAASEIADAAPFVGWVLRAASMALDAAEMLVSLGEVLSSPAVIEVDVKRQMTFNFTLHPDPKHGEPGKPDTAIWPAVADNYRILVNFKNGTGFEAKGSVPLTAQGGSSNAPISASFETPWGGSMQVIAAVYSKTGWLCGKYQSDWMDAVPDNVSTGIKAVSGEITEILVPLTQDTQYNFMQKIAYNNTNKHYWWGVKKGATIPTATVSSLSSSNVGNNIAELTGMTMNESAYVLGYGWKGSGENIPLEGGSSPDSGQMFVFQNISVLSDPESRLKFPSFGFKTKPGVAYDVYGGTDKEVGKLNFVLDTRNASTGYLRQIDLMDGTNNFNLDSGMSFGAFTLGDIDAMAVHPGGYIVAVNWASHRMQILKLADQAVPDANAPAAVVVSNKGIEQGLLLGPIALAISPDGKIMVLESISQRIQAFDISGNPAPSFPGKSLFTISNAKPMVAELNQKVVPPDLIASFISNGAAHLFNLDVSLSSILDAGGYVSQPILDAFDENMIYLAYMSDSQGHILPDPKQTSAITVVSPGRQWNITDPSRNYTYILTLVNNAISVEDQFNNTEVIVLSKDNSWQLKDLAGAKSFLLNLNGNNLEVSEYLSYFPINPQQEQLTYCDVAIESKGYLYVLAYRGDATKGNIPNTAYVLDVYTPQGEHLFRTPDEHISGSGNMQYVAAGKIALDIWRNLFSLNYEKLAGPAGRTEPSVSQWVPTPPLFNLDSSDSATLDSADMSKIAPLFAAHTITLSPGSTCKVIEKGQHWTIYDTANKKQYDVITSIGSIYVYDIAAS